MSEPLGTKPVLSWGRSDRKEIYEDFGLSPEDAQRLDEKLCEEMFTTLKVGREVVFNGVGDIKVFHHSARNILVKGEMKSRRAITRYSFICHDKMLEDGGLMRKRSRYKQKGEKLKRLEARKPFIIP